MQCPTSQLQKRTERQENRAELIRCLRGMAESPQVFIVRDEVEVHAPIERCFALSTHLAVVELTLAMRPVRGRMEGAVADGDMVRWRGWKWGLPHIHESLIEGFDPPFFFRDRMIAGRFAAFEHDHRFSAGGIGSVLLHDEVRFQMPYGAAGVMIGRSLVLPHVRKLLQHRFSLIKRLAEGEEWRQYIA